jgi:hypothetical protein
MIMFLILSKYDLADQKNDRGSSEDLLTFSLKVINEDALKSRPHDKGSNVAVDRSEPSLPTS